MVFSNVQPDTATTPSPQSEQHVEQADKTTLPDAVPDKVPGVAQEEWRIDELAQRVALPSRTIRFYNTQGLLPAPLMRGRVAFYTEEHVQVLQIIRDLKEQQNLPLDAIKHLLDMRTQHGDLHMHLELKQRLRFATSDANAQRFSLTEFVHRCSTTAEQVQELLTQELLFPTDVEGEIFFSGDDVLLVELYQHLEKLGLPIALATLLRFQLRQLVRSEIAAYEQHLLPNWQKGGLSLEEQTAHFERMLTLTDTLISIMHRRLLYQV